MEDAPVPDVSPASDAVGMLRDAVDLDRAANAIDLRRARLLATLKRMDLAPLGYASFRAFCAAEVGEAATWIRQLVTLAESPFPRIRAAVIAGRLAPSVAARGARVIDAEAEEAWLEDAVAGRFARARRAPEPKLEFTGEDVKTIHAARTLARLNLGQPVGDAQADRHILAAWRAGTPRQKILEEAHTPPPAPAPLPDPATAPWTLAGAAPDPADALVGPWQDPIDADHARALLRFVTAVRDDRVQQLATTLELIAQERAYAATDFRSFEAWARRTLSVDLRTLQRYRKALVDLPELDLDRALFVEDVGTDDTREAWRAIAPRVPAAELARVRKLARGAADGALREAYTRAIAEVDARLAHPSEPGHAAPSPETTITAQLPYVSLAATLPPPEAPRATEAHPELPTAARWYLVNGRPSKQQGTGWVKERDAYTCANPECARRTVRVHVHHTVFRRNGGTDAGDNLQLECPGCHLRLVHSGHLTIVAQGAWLVFTFRDRVIWMFGHPSRR